MFGKGNESKMTQLSNTKDCNRAGNENLCRHRGALYPSRGFSLGPWLIALIGLALLFASMQHSAGNASAADMQAAASAPMSADAARPANAVLPQIDETICAELTAVPQRECAALLALYLQTNGPTWADNTNWLQQSSPASPCDWAGVRCAGGHVTRLLLAGNHLDGTLPNLLGALSFLTHLNLADNLLRGPVPFALCELVDTVQAASLHYNQLFANNDRVAQCLTRLQTNWQSTQTIAPRPVLPTTIATNTIELTWQSIPYIGDAGYYEISYAPVISVSADLSYTVHGITADKSAGGYLLDGLTAGQNYRIRVRTHTPAHAAQANDQWSDYTHSAATTSTDNDPVLVMIYFPADNDLSPYVPGVIRRVQLGTRANPNIQVVMLVDARGDHNTVVMTIANGEITRTNAVQESWGTDELDSTDPAVLTWFLQNARTRFPASRTVVSLMGHGSGMTPEVEGEVFDEELPGPDDSGGIPALPKTIPATPGDYENRGGYLSTADFAQALAAATDNGANPFDVVFFDQCFQGNLDVLYEFHNYARAFVASPNYAWLSAPYHRYLIDFTPTATPETLAEAIIVHYQAALTNAQPNVIFWVRGADIPPIADAVSALGDALQQAVANGAETTVAQAALQSQYVDTTQCGRGNLQLGQPDELLGAGSFARNLIRGFDANTDGVRTAAETLLNQLANVHSLTRTGRPYIAPDHFWDYADSLTILAPLSRREMSHREMLQGNIWRASIYREQVPMAAVLASNPAQSATVTTAFAFAKEGRWNEFIDVWYTAPLTPTVGTRCYYMPPAIIRGTITETLALTITEQSNPTIGDTITVDWTPTTANDAAGYWLLVRPVDTIRWHLFDTVPLTQTTYLIQKPKPGIAYEFIVVAQDEVGTTLSESDQVRYAAVGPPIDRRIYLPIITR